MRACSRDIKVRILICFSHFSHLHIDMVTSHAPLLSIHWDKNSHVTFDVTFYRPRIDTRYGVKNNHLLICAENEGHWVVSFSRRWTEKCGKLYKKIKTFVGPMTNFRVLKGLNETIQIPHFVTPSFKNVVAKTTGI